MIFGKKESYLLQGIEDIKDKRVFKHIQYLDHIRKSVSDLKKINETGFTGKKEMQHVGRIPFLTWEANKDLFAPGGEINEQAIMKWLNEHSDFRTTERRV